MKSGINKEFETIIEATMVIMEKLNMIIEVC